jgi:hypothetical protein
VLFELLQEVAILPVSEPAHRVYVDGIIGRALGKDNASRGEEAAHPVIARFAVDVLAVVDLRVKRTPILARTLRALLYVVVEEPFPRDGMDDSGLGDYPVHVEYNGIELLSSQDDGSRFAHG